MNEYYAINAFFTSNPYAMYCLLAWSLAWKGLALWKSSQRREKIWFLVLLVLNTLGLLEILYLFIFSKYTRADKLAKGEIKEEKEKKELDNNPNKQKITKNKNWYMSYTSLNKLNSKQLFIEGLIALFFGNFFFGHSIFGYIFIALGTFSIIWAIFKWARNKDIKRKGEEDIPKDKQIMEVKPEEKES